jgi:hypothetical protein
MAEVNKRAQRRNVKRSVARDTDVENEVVDRATDVWETAEELFAGCCGLVGSIVVGMGEVISKPYERYQRHDNREEGEHDKPARSEKVASSSE